MNTKRLIVFILGLLIGIIIMFMIPVPSGLTRDAMIGGGIFICCIVWLSGEVFPNYVTMLVMISAWIISGVMPFNAAFSSFAGTSFWLLVGAMAIGAAATKSGLLLRFALLVLRLFPSNFSGQVRAFLLSGLIISPLVPSTGTKAAIMGPIAKKISDTMGYESCSKGSAGLFGAFFTGYANFGSIFLSSTFIAYSMVGTLPAEYIKDVTWFSWLYNVLPWGIVMVVLSYAALIFFYKPKDDKKMDPEKLNKMVEELGPMKIEEKIVTGVLAGCLLLWVLERQIGINSAVVSVIGMCILAAAGILNNKDFDTKMGWSTIIFIGGAMSMGTMLSHLGINNFIGNQIGPILSPVVSKPVFFILTLVLTVVLARFFTGTLSTTILFTAIVAPIGIAAGIHPWVIGFIAYVSTQVWFVTYNMPLFLIADASSGGEMISKKQAAFQSLINLTITVIGLLISIPWWQYLGLM